MTTISKTVHLDLTIEEVLFVYADMDKIAEHVLSKSEPPKLLVVKTNGNLNSVTSSIFLRSISNSILLENRPTEKLKVRGYLSKNSEGEVQGILNIKAYDDLYPSTAKVNVFSTTQGHVSISRQQIKTKDIQCVLYEHVTSDND